MLPRRCKKCRCYIAPQFDRCPRCNLRAPPVLSAIAKPTKEERAAERVKRDEKLPVIHSKNIHWVPSKLSVRAWTDMVDELKRRLAKADTPRLRNSVRSEMRLNDKMLARVVVPSGKNAWTHELFHAKHACITVFISPKGHRYVLATRDGPADLLMISRKKHVRSIPYVRLVRFEKSPYARMVKKEQQDETTHKKRKAAKKERRLKKRRTKPTLL